MKLRYRLLYVLPLLTILILDILFSDIITGHVDDDGLGSAPSPLAGYPALLITACIPLSVLLYKYLDGIARYVFWCALAALGLLAAESYLRYDVPVVYPHVFQKVMVLFTLPAIYGVYKVLGRIKLADVIGLIWVALLLNVILINPKALSIGAFVNHERGLVASSVYLLVLPLLFHFNTYLLTRKPLQLFLFFLATISILFFQHRTVWVVSTVCLALNTVLLLGTARQRLSFKALMPLVGIPTVALSLGLTTLAVSHPEILTKIAENISDIENHDKQGTGQWRAVQTHAYLPFIKENPVLGMRFKGFELPIQFYMPDNPLLVVFPDGHGHFFHSFYMDSLFYLGAVGLLLLCLPQLYAVLQLLRRPATDPETLTWLIFIATSLVYGYSYALPAYFYGLIGFGFVRMKQVALLAAALPVVATPAAAEQAPSSVSLPYPV